MGRLRHHLKNPPFFPLHFQEKWFEQRFRLEIRPAYFRKYVPQCKSISCWLFELPRGQPVAILLILTSVASG